jgi:Uma2 family endonuclease
MDSIALTYADYLKWPEKEGEKYELINGKVYMMASANWRHQRISGRLYSQISNYLEDKKCQIFYELDVRPEPKEDKSDDTVVRPDIIVVCDTDKLSKDGTGGVNGVPDLVVEVLSPSTANYDKIKKFNKYRETGVREFWIVDPETRLVEVNILENGKYTVSKYCVPGKDDVGLENIPSKIQVGIFENCVIDLERVFAEL